MVVGSVGVGVFMLESIDVMVDYVMLFGSDFFGLYL